MYIQSFAAQVILQKESEPLFLYLIKHYVFLYIYLCMYVSTSELYVSGIITLAFRKQWFLESYALMLNLSSSWHASEICYM